MSEILQVVQQGQLRGAEVFALDLAAGLGDGWNTTFVSLLPVSEPYAAAATRAGVAVEVMQPHGKCLRRLDWRVVSRLIAVIDRGEFGIVQANGSGTLKYVVAARQFSRRAWRLVYRAIGMGSHWRRGPMRQLAYRWLLHQPDLIVAVAQVVAYDLVRSSGVDARKLVVIPNGVDPQRLEAATGEREQVRAVLGIKTDESLIVYIGSLTPEKNLSALLNVVEVCRLRGLRVKTLLVGDGPCRNELITRMTSAHLEGAVHLLPPKPRVAPYLHAADLCVLPSRSEGMPALLIEAGLAGVPTVAYAVGGVSEVIDHGLTGLLVRKEDEAGLADAVAALATDDTRRAAMGLAARERYRRFNIAFVAGAYASAYRRLLHDGLAG